MTRNLITLIRRDTQDEWGGAKGGRGGREYENTPMFRQTDRQAGQEKRTGVS